jgi:hypothetical protein
MTHSATCATLVQLLKNGCALSCHRPQAQLAQLPPIDTGSQVAPPRARLRTPLAPQQRYALGGFACWALTTKDLTMTDDVHDKPPQELTTTDAKPVRERRVSPRVRHAIDLLLTGQCRLKKDAAAKAKLTPERLSRALKESHVIEYLTAQTRVLLAQSQAPAAATMLRLLDQAKSEHVQKDVAIHLLGISGHKLAADPITSVNINIQAGYVIDLTDAPVRTIDVTPGSQRDRH